MTLDDLRARPQHYLLTPLPTRVLVRLYRKWSRLERELAGGDPDAYDAVADRSASAYLILRDRGLEVCAYCDTVDGTHPGATCPSTLLDRLGISW